MNEEKRAELIRMGWAIHGVVEDAARSHPDPIERRRLLLADMAIHLLQTAIKPGDIALDQLTNNLHAILTLADPLLPRAGLKQATDGLRAEHAQAGVSGRTTPPPA